MGTVIIASFTFVHEAQLVKSLLEAEGIQTFIRNENIATQNWLYANAVGGVQLEVAEEEAETAKAILEKQFTLDEINSEANLSEGSNADPIDVCPQCGSDQLQYETTGKPGIFISWILTGAPIYPLGKRFRCLKCRFTWTP